MEITEYFKLQAKNLQKDFKTQKPHFGHSSGGSIFEYAPQFFNVDALINDFNIDEDNFTLMNAQHIIAKLSGFQKWTEMLKASPGALVLSLMLFNNMRQISAADWHLYISGKEQQHGVQFDDDDKLEIFRMVFAEVDGHHAIDYLLTKHENQPVEDEIIVPSERITGSQISELPLVGADRLEFIRTANSVFDRVLESIKPEHPKLVRRSWDPEKYIDEQLLRPDMLPIDFNYALSLIDAFLVHHVIGLAVEADEHAACKKR